MIATRLPTLHFSESVAVGLEGVFSEVRMQDLGQIRTHTLRF
jgi:hypothetical protein